TRPRLRRRDLSRLQLPLEPRPVTGQHHGKRGALGAARRARCGESQGAELPRLRRRRAAAQGGTGSAAEVAANRERVMRIRTQLLVSAWLACLLAIMVAGVLFYVTRQARIGLDDQVDAQDVARGVTNLLALSNEFSL